MKKYLFVTTTALGLIVGTAGAYAQSSGSGSAGGAAAPGGSPGSGGSMGSGSGTGERGSPSGLNRGMPSDGAQQPGGQPSQAPRGSDANTGQAPQGSERGQSQTPRGERNQGQTQRDMDRNQPSSRGDRNQDQAPREDTRERTQGQAPREGSSGQTERSGRDGQTRERGRENTGSAPSSASVTAEQRTRIKEHVSVLQSGRASKVNFNIRVGTSVPRSVRVYDLPPAIVEIVPAYRGYKYIYIEDEIVIVDPRTLRIVAMIEV